MSQVDVSGNVLSTFTDVTWPLHLSSDSEDHVMVIDWLSHPILLLNGHLQQQRDLVDINSSVELWWPQRLHYNELTSQIYVAHRSSSEWWSSRSDIISVLTVR